MASNGELWIRVKQVGIEMTARFLKGYQVSEELTLRRK